MAKIVPTDAQPGGAAGPGLGAFNASFAAEVMASGRRRVRLLAGVLSAIFLTLVVATFFPIFSSRMQPLFRRAFPSAAALLGGAVLYRLMAWALLGRMIRRGRRMPIVLRYLNAIVDTGIATLAMFIAVRVMPPLEALHGNHTLLYFLVIVLSVFHLIPAGVRGVR